PRDLRLARPLALLTLHRVEGRSVQREARIAHEVRALARAGHRPEAEISVGELALDPRYARRPVGAQRRDRLVAAGVEQRAHPRCELRLSLLERTPSRHGGAAYC